MCVLGKSVTLPVDHPYQPAAQPRVWRGCVSDCSLVPTGDYQSCQGCNIYASCLGGNLIDNRPCPVGTQWDDDSKECVYRSKTCPYGTLIALGKDNTHTYHVFPNSTITHVSSNPNAHA